MTERERFIAALERRPIVGHVPTFELVYFLTMEKFGKVHTVHRSYHQWFQMSLAEKETHLRDLAGLHIQIAETYHHSAMLIHKNPDDDDALIRQLEIIREMSGDEFFILILSDPTFAIPDGQRMMDFSVRLYEDEGGLKDEAKRRVDEELAFASKISSHKGLADGVAMCSDYCFNTNPFFTPDQFAEYVAPYLKDAIDGFREMGLYTIKHTDGNVMPILDQVVDCGPDAVHSLDPQANVSLREVKKQYGDRVCLIGNVNCGLMQTGTDSECKADIERALRDGMDGWGYIFSTSNCVYTGMPLERYEMMNRIWWEKGIYPQIS